MAEFIVFRKNGVNEAIINGCVIKNCPSVKTLDYYDDEFRTIDDHVKKLCQSLHFRLTINY